MPGRGSLRFALRISKSDRSPWGIPVFSGISLLPAVGLGLGSSLRAGAHCKVSAGEENAPDQCT